MGNNNANPFFNPMPSIKHELIEKFVNHFYSVVEITVWFLFCWNVCPSGGAVCVIFAPQCMWVSTVVVTRSHYFHAIQLTWLVKHRFGCSFRHTSTMFSTYFREAMRYYLLMVVFSKHCVLILFVHIIHLGQNNKEQYKWSGERIEWNL